MATTSLYLSSILPTTAGKKATTSQQPLLRNHLIAALQADVVGPYSLQTDSTETLDLAPSRWYLTGFLAPTGMREQNEGENGNESMEELRDRHTDDGEENEHQEPEPKRKKQFPASIGMSVFVPVDGTLFAEIHYADYQLQEKSEGEIKNIWQRLPKHYPNISIPLDPQRLKQGIVLSDSNGIVLVGQCHTIKPTAGGKPYIALSLFLLNQREGGGGHHRDQHYIFQVALSLHCAQGFLPKGDLSEGVAMDWDQRVAHLQYRDSHTYAIGHGIATYAHEGEKKQPVTTISTCWLPHSEVKKVVSVDVDHLELDMFKLAACQTAEQIQQALHQLPKAYDAWLAEQKRMEVLDVRSQETQSTLVEQGMQVKARIVAGLRLLQQDEELRKAFCLTNQAMARAATRRNRHYKPGDKIAWRTFQLAFLLMNIQGMAEPMHADRETVDLIFFPTGGGKTEAYLGVIAFTILLRRLRGQASPHQGLGVAVLLRYTLRLLTIDQLSRATTLICALELLRRDHPELGQQRFAVGQWVGRTATANTLEEVRKQLDAYKDSEGQSAQSPCPLADCPWCNTPLTRDSFSMVGKHSKKPSGFRISCTNPACDFLESKEPNGLPLLIVDEQIYRELPCFLISTVDKFAMLPMRGESGMLFGAVTGHDGVGFVGPMDKSKKVTHRFPQGLLPPDLIVQDELHLIAGPLGSMVGLYETALDLLCSRDEGSRTIRPKIIASTATVRRADRQIRALFGRADTTIFPPPGVTQDDCFFAQTDDKHPGRYYVGVAAVGRSMKNILLRVYVTLLAAAAKIYTEADQQKADGYMTLVGYFNSLRELGGMRRLVEDEVHQHVRNRLKHKPLNEPEDRWFGIRPELREVGELTSRESTAKIASLRAQVSTSFSDKDQAMDVLLASNMISVGIDIDRLGLMVLAGQPKTTSEYIQASSRVGRNHQWPGLVVTCLNTYKARDKSHYEHFHHYHQSFYRSVEAMSLTPFSSPAIDRGFTGALIATLRLSLQVMTANTGAIEVGKHRSILQKKCKEFAQRASMHLPSDDQKGLQDYLEKKAEHILDQWVKRAGKILEEEGELTYSRFEKGEKQSNLLQDPISVSQHITKHGIKPIEDQRLFAVRTSMRDVEPVSHLWIKHQGKGSHHG